MLSPAQRHMARVNAALLAGASSPAGGKPARVLTGREASAYEQMRVKMAADLRQLKTIQSLEKKIALKRELLPAYDPWIEGVLEAAAAGNVVQDDILVRVMIWRIDCGLLAEAMPLVAHVLRHNLTLPAQFERTTATLIVEETAEAALTQLGKGEDFDFEILDQVDDLTADEDMPDEVRAKLKKAIGLVALRRAQDPDVAKSGPAGAEKALLAQARAAFERALELDRRVGCKGELDRLKKADAKAPAEGDVK